jgi:hypothetical protein
MLKHRILLEPNGPSAVVKAYQVANGQATIEDLTSDKNV